MAERIIFVDDEEFCSKHAIVRLALAKILEQLLGFEFDKDPDAAEPVSKAQRWVVNAVDRLQFLEGIASIHTKTMIPMINALKPHCFGEIRKVSTDHGLEVRLEDSSYPSCDLR